MLEGLSVAGFLALRDFVARFGLKDTGEPEFESLERKRAVPRTRRISVTAKERRTARAPLTREVGKRMIDGALASA